MTILVGILNKRGAVIAADSAVTYTDYSREINLDFSRSKEINDILNEIKQNCRNGNEEIVDEIDRKINFIGDVGNEWMMDHIIDNVNKVYGKNQAKEEIVKRIKKNGNKRIANIINNGNKLMRLTDSSESPICVMATGSAKIDGLYLFDAFIHFRKREGKKVYDNINDCIKDVVDFTENFYKKLKKDDGKYNDGSVELVFTGYGKNDEFPRMITVEVVFKSSKVSFKVKENSGVSDDEENLSVFKFFGRPDTIKSLLTGVNLEYLHQEYNDSLIYKIFNGDKDLIIKHRDDKLIDGLKYYSNYYNEKDNLNKWKERIKDFDLDEMAEYAEMFIELTELYHLLRSLPIQAGGPVDIACITKERGFEWIQCKDYYTYASKNNKIKRNDLPNR